MIRLVEQLQQQILSTDIDDTPIVEVLAERGDVDDPGEEDPSTYKYTLTGDTGTLNGIRKMIDDLCLEITMKETE